VVLNSLTEEISLPQVPQHDKLPHQTEAGPINSRKHLFIGPETEEIWFEGHSDDGGLQFEAEDVEPLGVEDPLEELKDNNPPGEYLTSIMPPSNNGPSPSSPESINDSYFSSRAKTMKPSYPRPFPCPHCDKSYCRPDHVHRHIRTNHEYKKSNESNKKKKNTSSFKRRRTDYNNSNIYNAAHGGSESSRSSASGSDNQKSQSDQSSNILPTITQQAQVEPFSHSIFSETTGQNYLRLPSGFKCLVIMLTQ